MKLYSTVRAEASAEQIIEKSRFIAYVSPAETREEADEFIASIRKKHKDATHNVPAMVLGDKFQIQWGSDDGEPQGTSGAPIVQMLVAQGITNVVVVVTRYFGGILLGAGGLCRAYTKAAKDALDAAGISKMQPWVRQQITVSYALFERAKLLIAAQEGTVEDAQYGADILITYRIPEGADEWLRTALREASSGSVIPSLLEEIFCAG